MAKSDVVQVAPISLRSATPNLAAPRLSLCSKARKRARRPEGRVREMGSDRLVAWCGGSATEGEGVMVAGGMVLLSIQRRGPKMGSKGGREE